MTGRRVPIETATIAGGYVGAVRSLAPIADDGPANVQLAMGYLYLMGVGVSKDETRGAALVGKAAAKGTAPTSSMSGATSAVLPSRKSRTWAGLSFKTAGESEDSR